MLLLFVYLSLNQKTSHLEVAYHPASDSLSFYLYRFQLWVGPWSSLNMLRLRGREASLSLAWCLVAGSKPCCPSCCCLEEMMGKSVRMRSLAIKMETEYGRWSLHLNFYCTAKEKVEIQHIPKILNGVKVWTVLWPIHVWKCYLMLPKPLFHNWRPDDSWHIGPLWFLRSQNRGQNRRLKQNVLFNGEYRRIWHNFTDMLFLCGSGTYV